MADDISLFAGAAWFLVFLFSTTVHEAGHAFVALKLGDDTAARGGQVSLDPIPHVQREPIGMIVIPILSYLFGGWMMGWASAPYDPIWARRNPKRAGLMALAGPLANLLQMLLAILVMRICMRTGFFVPADRFNFMNVVEATSSGYPHVCAVLVSLFFSMNLLLFVFNLIPVAPLDGGSIPLFFLSDANADKYWEFVSTPGFTFVGIFIAWELSRVIVPPAFKMALRLLFAGTGVL